MLDVKNATVGQVVTWKGVTWTVVSHNAVSALVSRLAAISGGTYNRRIPHGTMVS